MLKRSLMMLSVLACAWFGSADRAAAHERWYEFDGTHFALSIDRFMGIDFTDFEGPGRSDVHARFLLNADEPVPTSWGRVGFDVFLRRLSIGVAGGVTDKGNAIIAPRVGYLFGLTPTLGFWLRGGVFFASANDVDYLGIYADALLAWFPYPVLAVHLGPTLDLAFTDTPGADYVSIGLPQVGLTAFF